MRVSEVKSIRMVRDECRCSDALRCDFATRCLSRAVVNHAQHSRHRPREEDGALVRRSTSPGRRRRRRGKKIEPEAFSFATFDQRRGKSVVRHLERTLRQTPRSAGPRARKQLARASERSIEGRCREILPAGMYAPRDRSPAPIPAPNLSTSRSSSHGHDD